MGEVDRVIDGIGNFGKARVVKRATTDEESGRLGRIEPFGVPDILGHDMHDAYVTLCGVDKGDEADQGDSKVKSQPNW